MAPEFGTGAAAQDRNDNIASYTSQGVRGYRGEFQSNDPMQVLRRNMFYSVPRHRRSAMDISRPMFSDVCSKWQLAKWESAA